MENPTENYLVTLGNVEASYLKCPLPHKVYFFITYTHASTENFHFQQTALSSSDCLLKFYGSDATRVSMPSKLPAEPLKKKSSTPSTTKYSKGITTMPPTRMFLPMHLLSL
jgi:hypothetical protein